MNSAVPADPMRPEGAVLVIACGAIAHELIAVLRASKWDGAKVQCLPAELHNRPQAIPDAVREKIRAARGSYRQIFVAYADCGTGGMLDQVLAEEGVERLPGAHCYEFFAGRDRFAALADAEPGTFYLTDFMVRHFERLVVRGLGLDRHPELMPVYFGNYRRLIYLAQVADPGLEDKARAAAVRLGLEYGYELTGYGDLAGALVSFRSRGEASQWRS